MEKVEKKLQETEDKLQKVEENIKICEENEYAAPKNYPQPRKYHSKLLEEKKGLMQKESDLT